jgi:DNA repair protein RadD
MYKLRYYQTDSSNIAYDILTSKRTRKELLVLPTGTGKSVIISATAKRLKSPLIVLQPSKELLEQNYQKFINSGGKASIYSASAGIKEIGKITFATIGSIIKEVDKLKSMGVKNLIVDEAHIGVKSGSQLRSFIKSLGITNIVGLTASPFVLESGMGGSELKMLTKLKNKLFSDIAYVSQIKDLAGDFWTPLSYEYINQDKSILEVNTSGSDYTDNSIKLFYKNNDIEGQIVNRINEAVKNNRKAILVFVPSIEEAETLSSKVIGSRYVSSKTSKVERDEIIDGFKNGSIKTVINVGILTTGFDYPELDTVIIARSTMSFSLYYQMVGRGCRIHNDKKETVIVDFSENFTRFGKVEDFTIDYLEGYGWGLFKGEYLISNYPIDAISRPTKKTLLAKKAHKLSKPNDVVFHFGKHNGKPVSYVMEKDKKYIVWLASNKEFNWFGTKGKALKAAIDYELIPK